MSFVPQPAREDGSAAGDEALAVSLIIPTRGEEEVLAHTVRAAHAWLTSRHGTRFEIIIVPNRPAGTPADRTPEIAAGLARQLVGVCSHPRLNDRGEGKGAAIRHGVQRARGRHVFLIDADFAYDFTFFDRAAMELERGAVFVAGNRRLEGSTFDVPTSLLLVAWHRFIAGRVFNLAVRSMLPIRSTDTQAGIKAMTRSFAQLAFEKATCPSFFHDVELFVIAHAQQLPQVDLPVALRLRSERTNVRLSRDGLLALLWLGRIAWQFRDGRYHSGTTR